ncbi:tRNA pseudouridine synthase mitochondrial precursor, partial [Volvox carteri f. nagariensis]
MIRSDLTARTAWCQVVAYDGCEFAGFQFQAGKVRTVQGELERGAKRLFHGCSRMVGASRTDGGAHAYGQVVHFDVYGTRDSLESDALYYNSFLPPDVRVLGLSYAEDGFDSHFSSCGKTYLYKFAAGLPDPLQSKYRWWVYDRWCERSRGKPGKLSDVELDVGLMQQAADMLLGRHDFSAFMDNKRPA